MTDHDRQFPRVGRFYMKARRIILFGAFGLIGCGGPSRGPARTAIEPGSSPLTSTSDEAGVVTAPVAGEAPASGADAATTKGGQSAGTSGAEQAPPPLPATTKLSRGSGSKIDAALALGDTAFEADDFASAEARYREAAGLGPNDAAPLVGMARVAIAKTNGHTDDNAPPKNTMLGKAALS